MASVSVECRPLYRPRYLPIVGRYVDQHSADISVDTSVDTSTDTSRSTYRPPLDRYVNRYIGRHSAAMSTDTSVECRTICRPRCRPIYRSRGAQNTHDPISLVRLRKLAPSRNAVFNHQTGMDFVTEISFCKTPVVDEKRLVFRGQNNLGYYINRNDIHTPIKHMQKSHNQ